MKISVPGLAITNLVLYVPSGGSATQDVVWRAPLPVCPPVTNCAPSSYPPPVTARQLDACKWTDSRGIAEIVRQYKGRVIVP